MEETAANYLLPKHYRGGPKPMPIVRCGMDLWTPQEVEAHLAFIGQPDRPLSPRTG